MRLPTTRDAETARAYRTLEQEDLRNQKIDSDISIYGRDAVVYDASSNPISLVDLVSGLTQQAACYVSSASATTISVAGTYYKAAGTTTQYHTSTAWEHSDNRLTYKGTPNIIARVWASVGSTSGASNQTLSFRLAKNGTATTTRAIASQVDRQIGTNTDEGAAAVFGLFPMATDDYVELWVTNETSTATVTIAHMNMLITGHVSADTYLAPATATLTLTGQPVVGIYHIAYPATGTLTLTGYAPTVT